MKSNEFVRVFGLDIARMAINEYTPECDLNTVELKRLVESHEIVNKTFKGLDDAKWWCECCWDCDSVAYITIDRLKQAISDVESCQ